jgi:hypothetical protein
MKSLKHFAINKPTYLFRNVILIPTIECTAELLMVLNNENFAINKSTYFVYNIKILIL